MYWPAAHSAQLSDEAAPVTPPYVPCEQLEHVDVPVEAWKKPAPQYTHAVAPELDAYKPATHGAQLVDAVAPPVARYVPAGQDTQVARDVALVALE